MSDRGAYGERLADIFHLTRAPAFVSHSLRKTEIAVTEIRCDIENNGLTSPIPPEDGFLLTVQVRDCPKHELWLDDRPARSGYLKAGASSIYDLRRNPIALSISPFHSLHFYVPHRAFNAIADIEGHPYVDEFDNEPGTGANDPLLHGLGQAILPAFDLPAEANRLFVEHITFAAAAWALRTYGVDKAAPQAVARELSPSLEKRAKEILSANLDGNLSLSGLAKECDLPVGEFCRSFRDSTGMQPYRWLIQRRIEKAKDLLRLTTLSLATIAASAGFVDERHLERVFRRVVDVPPRVWRHLED